MANTAGVTSSFKSEVMMGYHQLGQPTLGTARSTTTPTNDTLKAALYQTSATIGPATTAYTATGEVATAGGYSAGGATVTNATAPSTSGTTGIWTPSASLVWTGVSFTTDCVLIYNSSQGNRSISSHTFSSQTVTSGNFTLTMPTNDASNALVRIA
jgi:hypothetical protein